MSGRSTHAAPEEAAYALIIELFAPSACRNMKAIFPACWRCTTKPLTILKRKRPSVRRGRRCVGERVTPAGDAQALAG